MGIGEDICLICSTNTTINDYYTVSHIGKLVRVLVGMNEQRYLFPAPNNLALFVKRDVKSEYVENAHIIVGGQVVRRGARIALCEEYFHPVASVVGRNSIGGYLMAAWWVLPRRVRRCLLWLVEFRLVVICGWHGGA